jgi:hypothetical protein
MGRIYNALDRFLPFDRYLDPMFGGQPTASPIPGRPPMRGMAPQGSSGAMGSLAMPQAGAPRVAMGEKRVPKVSKLRVLDGVLGGLTFTDAIDAERARPAALAAAQEERDQIASYVSQFPPERQPEIMLAIKANPKAFGEAIFTPRVVGEAAYTPSGFQMPGMSDAQRASAAKPIPTEGGAYVPMAGTNGVPTGYQFRGAPQIVKSGVDENITEITPGGAPPMVARSPEVGQFIKSQLEGIPGLRLGSAEPRSEREIASLSLSAPNTYHRQGAALDFTAPGQNPDEVIAAVRSRMGAGYDVIYHPENGSFHVEPGPQWSPPGGSDGARVISRGSAKPVASFRAATAEEKAAYNIPADQAAQIGPDGRINPVGERLKPVPIPVVQALTGNNAGLATIDRALEAIQAYPGAVGMANYLPDPIRQRQDPAGIDARATIADISSMVIHDRSGAAVTAAEFPRLAPFIPSATDSPETVRRKLLQLREKLSEDTAWLAAPYGEENGYRPLTISPPTRPGAQGATPGATTRTGAATPPPPRRDAPAAKPAAATPPRKAAPAAASGAPVKVRTVQEAEQLPPNTRFVLPDGRSGTKR